MAVVYPSFLRSKSDASKKDNPIWNQAINEPFTDEYWKAVQKEINTLEGMDAWDILSPKMKQMTLMELGPSSASNFPIEL